MIDGFHAVSEAIAKEGMKYGADDSKIKVIYSSVKDELFKENIKLYKTDQTLEIVSIGRFHWKKPGAKVGGKVGNKGGPMNVGGKVGGKGGQMAPQQKGPGGKNQPGGKGPKK